jgi:acetolactate synthase-1/2/3 large subunit
MGFGLPAAIGAALAKPDRTILCVSGDGSFQMNIQELATLAELGLPVKIIILNNGHLGLVRQQQELFYERRFIASRFGKRLDFASLAGQFGIPSLQVTGPGQVSSALAAALPMTALSWSTWPSTIWRMFYRLCRPVDPT